MEYATALVLGSQKLFLLVLVASFSLAIMLATEPSLSIVWDEGYSLGREARLRSWFTALVDPPRFAKEWQPPVEDLVPPNRYPPPPRGRLGTHADLFSSDALDWFWPFAREEPDGHPPVYALVGLLGDLAAPRWEPLPRARLGPMVVFSLICGAAFSFLETRWGPWSAFAALSALLLQPHLFALSHYATYDGLLTSLWIGCALAFASAAGLAGIPGRRMSTWFWGAGFAVLLAAALGTKLTGWFLPLPFLAWNLLYRHRSGFAVLGIGCVLAVILLILLTPPWWHDPIGGLDRFFESNLTRARTTPLKTLFLGNIYETPTGSLPWYNTLVLTLAVTPVGFLILATAGGIRAVSNARGEPIGTLFLVHWIFLMVLRALPHTPGHDGVRQFLPAFGLLALLTGLGAGFLVRRWGACGRSLVLLSFAEGIASVGLMMPVPLSYFSPLVGGLPGAARIGMEPTYYWDSLQPEILDWLNTHTSEGQKVLFARYPTSWLYLRQTKKLRVNILNTEPGRWTWYVVQNRPGALTEQERYLISRVRPAMVYSKFGVPLIWVFPYRELPRSR